MSTWFWLWLFTLVMAAAFGTLWLIALRDLERVEAERDNLFDQTIFRAPSSFPEITVKSPPPTVTDPAGSADRSAQ